MTAKRASAASELRVPRSATVRRSDGSLDTRPLMAWRHFDTYVLLGDPGAGKSESLRAESEAVGGKFITARNFIALGIDAADAHKTVFIDGLDEMRAGAADGRAPLEAIRTRLKSLGHPSFRLSCREADWRAQTDLTELAKVARNGSIQELHLEPLSREEQLVLLQGRYEEIADARHFLSRADEIGVAALFGNPLLLDLTVRAVASNGQWPDSRSAIYDLACRELATEHSLGHQDAKPLQPGDIDRLLQDAGLLCAVLLLSGKSSLSRTPDAVASSIAWYKLPDTLKLHDANAALASKIFTTTAGDSAPRHRSVAEYLAGQAITRRILEGLPLGRILALMQGGDGGVVEPLRGLLGWLAVHHARDRMHLIRLDPLAVVLNGDVATYSTSDKLVLLESLRDQAERNPWFRNQQWVSHPFAGLASSEMTSALDQVLADHSTTASHQALVDCVLDAMRHGQPLSLLRARLEEWVEDGNAQFGNRIGALEAWTRCTGFDANKASDWLNQAHQGSLPDQDARLSSALLSGLYPGYVGPDQVLRYLPRANDVSENTSPPRFWYDLIIERSRPQDFAVLVDAWLRLEPQPEFSHHNRWWSRLRSRILAKALEEAGDQVSDERLHAWLGIRVDRYGFARLESEAGHDPVAQWLTDRPDRAKSVVAFGWRATQPDMEPGRSQYWRSEQLIRGAKLPRDWLHWMLDQAADAPDERLAQYCFDWVAHAAIEPPPGFDVPTMMQVEEWVAAHEVRWPQARAWLEGRWSSRLENNWQSDQHRREKKQSAESLAKKEARRKSVAPHMDAIIAGTAPAWLMHQLAGAYEERFYDIKGDTPEQRVRDFLVVDDEGALAAIAGLTRVLERDDLPSADEVFAVAANGKEHFLRPAALLAARLAYEREPRIPGTWPDALLSTLVACWLTDGSGDMPDWYKMAAELRPAVVAPLLVRHAQARLRRKVGMSITGLWEISHETGHAALARLVLPPLLKGFPRRASEPARQVLNQSLLAALHLLDDDEASKIVRQKLAQPSVDAVQRICWLVADLPYRKDAAQRLVDEVANSERRAVALGNALFEQRSLSRALGKVQPATLSRLIELLAPVTRAERPMGAHWVGPEHKRTDTVRALLDLLASDPDPNAGAELQRLVDMPRMKPWREHLRYSLLSQQGVAREAFYIHPSPEGAALTLANRAPANQADLTALTLDHLREIERDLRGSNASGLAVFWDRHGERGNSPKDENECRDRLLERLRDRIAPLGVLVDPEHHAAQDKRADMCVQYMAAGRRLALPIEIKRENHRSVWLAWRDQLQALYTIDPAADGHGIYLVLWFGQKPRPSPEGEKPATPKEFKHRLTERIPLKDRARLVVRVMDLSLPPQH